jgi:hypothetical protein
MYAQAIGAEGENRGGTGGEEEEGRQREDVCQLAWRWRAHKNQEMADGILLLVDSSESNRRQLLAGAFSFGSSLLLGQQASFVPTPPAMALSRTSFSFSMQEPSGDSCAGAKLTLEAFSSLAGGSRGHSGRCDWKPKAAGCPRPPQGMALATSNPLLSLQNQPDRAQSSADRKGVHPDAQLHQPDAGVLGRFQGPMVWLP